MDKHSETITAFPKESFLNTGSGSFVKAPQLSSGFSFQKSQDLIFRQNETSVMFHRQLSFQACRMQGTWVWLNLRASLCIQRYLKPQIINSDGHMRKRPQKHGFVIQCGCNSSAMSPLPVVSSLLSLALHLGSLNDQAWVMRVTSSHILWIKTVNLTGRGRHSLSTSFDMFVAAISLNGMCAENRGQWDSESEVAEHFELVIISLKNHVCSTMREAPCLFLVSSCFCGNCYCHGISFLLETVSHLNCSVTVHLFDTSSLSLLILTIRILAWRQYPYFQLWPLFWVSDSHFQVGVSHIEFLQTPGISYV